MRPDGVGEHESACHFAEPLDVVHAEAEELQHHFAEREDASPQLRESGAGRSESPFEDPYDRRASSRAPAAPTGASDPTGPGGGGQSPEVGVRERSRRRRDSSRDLPAGPAAPLRTHASRPHSSSSWVQPRGHWSVPGSRSGKWWMIRSGSTCASPKDRMPGVSTTQPRRPGGAGPPPRSRCAGPCR